MKFLIGTVALLVICVVFGSPAIFLLGWRPLMVSERHIAGTKLDDRGPEFLPRARP
jgi:hypothetical protein